MSISTAERVERAERRKKASLDMDRVIEASPVDEGVKLIVKVLQQHGQQELEVNQEGHEGTRAAIVQQTKAGAGVAFLGFVLVVVAMLLVAQSRGVDVGETADAVKVVTDAARGPVAAQDAPVVAAEPAPAPESHGTAGADHGGDSPLPTAVPPGGEE